MVKVGRAISFLTFSGFASTGLGRGGASTPERRPATEGNRPKATAGPCAGLSGRLSTPLDRLWQASAGHKPAIAIALAVLLPAPATAGSSELADRIAEALCYPPSAREMRLEPAADADYRRTARMAGAYRDIQGADARAWFRKSGDAAVCRSPADSAMTLYFCAPVSHAPGLLTKARPRLCE